MDEVIFELRRKKFTIEQIADHLGMTVGQVKYRIYKKGMRAGADQTSDLQEQLTSSKWKEIPTPPLYYGDEQLTLMVQGPTSIYTYWEISWPLRHMLSEFLNIPYEHMTQMLRLYDTTEIWFDGNNAHWHRDILIHQGADNWFIYDLPAGRTYTVDWGIKWEDRYIPVLRSQPKSTPNNQPAGDYCPIVSVEQTHSTERIKPKWFENFSTYTLY